MVWRHDNEMQRMLRDSIESHLEATHSMDRVRACRASDAGFDAAEWKTMAQMGWTGVLISEDKGGAGLPLSEAQPLADVMGRNLVPEPFVASAIISATILNACTGAAAQGICDTLLDGSRVVTLAFQERTGMNNAKLASVALANGKLNGTKKFVAVWSDITDLLVTCVSNGQPAIAFVPNDAPGLSVTTQELADGTAMAEIAFKDVAVSDDNVLLQGPAAEAALDLAIAHGTLALCAQMEGLASGAFDMTVEYMNNRVQFKQAISQFQANRFTMVDLDGEVELGGASWRQALQTLENEGLSQARIAIAAAKARCSEMVLSVTKAGIQYHGGIGYTEDANIGLFLKSAVRLSSWLGGAAHHRMAAYNMHLEG